MIPENMGLSITIEDEILSFLLSINLKQDIDAAMRFVVEAFPLIFLEFIPPKM